MKVALYLTDTKCMHDGVTRFLHKIVEIIESDGVDADFIGGALLSRKEKAEKIAEDLKEVVPNVPVRLKKTKLPGRVLSRTEYLLPMKYDKLFGEKADLYVFPINFMPRNKPKNAKSVVVMHDISPLLAVKYPWLLKKLYKHMYGRTVKNADLIFTDSENSKKEIVGLFPKAADKIVVNYCGTDAEAFAAPVTEEKAKAVREKYGTGEGYYLFVGRDRENKNLPRLLEAYAALPKEIREKRKIVIANHLQPLKEYAETLQTDGIVLLDGVDEEDLTALVQGAAALCLVSVSEGFGLPLIEGMAAGVPTIASNVSCLPEVAGGASLLVDPYDVQSISDALQRVVSDEALREELIKKGKKRAATFTWENSANTFKEEIKRILCK